MNKFNSDINLKNYYGLATKVKEIDRLELFQKQRQERGFDETEWYTLNVTILKFTLPRLKEFKNCKSYPDEMTYQEWTDIIDSIILEIENYLTDKSNDLTLFFKYFKDLWS